MATVCQRGASAVQKIMGYAWATDESMDANFGMLEGKNLKIYEASINVLINTLKSSIANSKVVSNTLSGLDCELRKVQYKLD